MAQPLSTHTEMKLVSLDLADGTSLECSFFTSGGTRSVQDLLNDHRNFIPISVDGKIELLNKSMIKRCRPIG